MAHPALSVPEGELRGCIFGDDGAEDELSRLQWFASCEPEVPIACE